MAAIKKKPAIRFKDFKEEWEEKRLQELSLINTGFPFDSKTFEANGEYLVITNGNIQNESSHVDGTLGNRINLYDSRLKEYVLDIDDILVTMDGTVGRTAKVIKTKQILAQRVGRLVAITDADFLYHYLNTGHFFKKMSVISHGGTIKHISLSEISAYESYVPNNVIEQAQIGSYFSELDNLIQFEEQKLKKVSNLKKAMLEKMFPKQNEDVPEIRFKGFNDKWEKKTVGEYYFFKNGLNKGKEFFGHGTPIVNFTDVFHKRGINSSELKGKVKLDLSEIANYGVNKGDVFFTRTSETINEIGYPSVMLDEPQNTVFSGFVLRGRAIENDPLDLVFKKYVFFTSEFRKEMVKKSSMTTRALTSGTAIKQMYFYFPKDINEQQKIGEYFQKIDQLINQSQQRIKQLKHLKQALLQKMFI